MTPDFRIFAFPRLRWWAGIVLAMALLLAAPGYVGRQVDRLFVYVITALHPKNAERPAAALPDYQVSVEGRELEAVGGKVVGLAWDSERGQLWAVADDPTELLALSPDGEVLARHPLVGFDGVSGVASLGGGRLILAERGRRTLVMVPAPHVSGEALSGQGRQTLRLALPGTGERGVGGIGYDRDGDRLFALQGHSPSRLYEIRGLRSSLEGRGEAQVIDRSAWIGGTFVARDFAAVKYEARSGNLLLLSNASRLVLEIDGNGRFVGYQPLAAGFAGLKEGIPHAAAMSIDDERHLYLASTANRFYAFQPE